VKALVLAGGAGTRLRPITYTSAKQLVPVANQPILFYGWGRSAMPASPTSGSSSATRRRRSRPRWVTATPLGIEVTWIHQEAPLGLAHAVTTAADWLGDDDFVMFLGDNLIEGGSPTSSGVRSRTGPPRSSC
jgi:glucose-1-phosphate thymidylyltransferase